MLWQLRAIIVYITASRRRICVYMCVRVLRVGVGVCGMCVLCGWEKERYRNGFTSQVSSTLIGTGVLAWALSITHNI